MQIDLYTSAGAHERGRVRGFPQRWLVMHAGDIFSARISRCSMPTTAAADVEMGRRWQGRGVKNVDRSSLVTARLMTVAICAIRAIQRRFAAAVQAAKKAGRNPDDVARVVDSLEVRNYAMPQAARLRANVQVSGTKPGKPVTVQCGHP